MQRLMMVFAIFLLVVPNVRGTDYYQRQWYLENDGNYGSEDCDVDAEDAWAITKGDTSVTIAVLDTGFPMWKDKSGWHYHPDLNDFNKIVLGPSIAHIVLGGGSPDSIIDMNGHGTAVAGIIGGKRTEPSDDGIRGIASGCKLLFIQTALDYHSDDTPECFYRGVVAACSLGADVINYSYGRGLSIDTTY